MTPGRTLQVAPLTIALLGLLGCSSSIQPPDLEFEPPGQFDAVDGAGAPEPVDATTELSVDWWSQFGDPNLDSVVTDALANNPALVVAAANFDAAMARARIAGADLYPQVGVGLPGSRRKQNFIGFPIPGGENEVLSTTATNVGLSLNVSWEVDLWGRLRATQKAALTEAAASREDLAAARLSVSAQAAKLYLSAVETQLQVELAEETLTSRRLSERRVLARYERGLSPSLEVRLARTQTAAVEASLEFQRQLLDATLRQLEALLGRYPDAELATADALPAVPPPLETGIPAELLARRPDLRAAEQRALSAAAQLRAAKRALYPSFSLTGSAGTASAELTDLVNGNFSVWGLAASLLQPLFQGGRLRAGVDLADAGVDGATARWLETTLDAYREVETAIAAEGFLDLQVDALTEAALQSRAAERLALDRYSNGLSDYLNVLESQRSSFQAESARLTAERERLSARVDLILALGGSPTPEAQDSAFDTESESEEPDARE